MPITTTRLTPHFAAQIDGADITRPMDDATWHDIRAAFEEHSVLLFRGQLLTDEQQIAFSQRFGRLEVTRSMNPAAGTPFARQANLDIKTGEIIPAEDRRMIYQLANMLWHSDSSFKAVPSLCSLLSARIVAPEGGATEFASARCAYASLPDALKRRARGGVVVHDFSWSRDQIRPGFFTDKEARGVSARAASAGAPESHQRARTPLLGRPRLPRGRAAGGRGPRVPQGAPRSRDAAAVLPPPRVAGR